MIPAFITGLGVGIVWATAINCAYPKGKASMTLGIVLAVIGLVLYVSCVGTP